MTSNELRAVIGMAPSDEKKADQLTNSNLYQQPQQEIVEDVTVEEDQG